MKEFSVFVEVSSTFVNKKVASQMTRKEANKYNACKGYYDFFAN